MHLPRSGEPIQGFMDYITIINYWSMVLWCTPFDFGICISLGHDGFYLPFEYPKLNLNIVCLSTLCCLLGKHFRWATLPGKRCLGTMVAAKTWTWNCALQINCLGTYKVGVSPRPGAKKNFPQNCSIDSCVIWLL